MEPYEVDAHTLHLWHLDEDEPPFADNGVSPKPLLGLLNGATAGNRSMPGMGRSVSFNHSAGGRRNSNYFKGALLMAQPKSVDGPKDNVTAPFPIMGDDGAFTMEGLVKFERLPAESPGMSLTILSMDSEDENRVFNFRIEKSGFLSFSQFSGASVRGGGLATIPVIGPHAINTRDWFHVAVTYDGRESSAGNLKFFWTRITHNLERANLLGGGSLAEDLSTGLGDFVIGNTGRTVLGKKECNPFPGLIDEVRISSVARPAHDFLFVSPEAKAHAASEQAKEPIPPGFQLALEEVAIGGQRVGLPPGASPLLVDPGHHRLDIDFSLAPGFNTADAAVRCCLEGTDEPWQPAVQGMLLTCEVLDHKGEILSRTSFASTGQSLGWSGDLYESPLVSRLEPLFLPKNSNSVRITLSSGTPDTTGQIVIDNVAIHPASATDESLTSWPNEIFERGKSVNSVSGTPDGWLRGGADPAIARLVIRPESRAIGLVDGEQTATGTWASLLSLPKIPREGSSVLLSWDEAFDIVGGGFYRASYLNVPAGSYHFRAIAVTRNPVPASTHLELPIIVRTPLWENPWFRPTATATGVGLIALLILQTYRRRALFRFSKLNLRHTLERDRARIARDMHDDLGTRVSNLIMDASLVQRDLTKDSVATHRHLVRMGTAARDLATAMDELIWAVDPANDTLDQLASHLGGLIQDMFHEERFRVHIRIATDLPHILLRSEFRHHFSLAVKEALHNVLKHAGSCEVTLEVSLKDDKFTALVRDTGTGFNTETPAEGNGLLNLHTRLAELGGSCSVESTLAEGTTVTLSCSLTHQARPVQS